MLSSKRRREGRGGGGGGGRGRGKVVYAELKGRGWWREREEEEDEEERGNQEVLVETVKEPRWRERRAAGRGVDGVDVCIWVTKSIGIRFLWRRGGGWGGWGVYL